MKSRPLSTTLIAAYLVVSGTLAQAHQGHEIDRELLAAKIRESGHPCESVTEAREKSENPTLMAVQCGSDHHYELVITGTDFSVTPSPQNSGESGKQADSETPEP
jgi:hypothetical protein